MSSFSTGPPGDRGELHCRWNVIATLPIGLVPFQARGILPVADVQSEEQRLAATKAAALRINLNVEGCGIVAAAVEHGRTVEVLCLFRLTMSLQ